MFCRTERAQLPHFKKSRMLSAISRACVSGAKWHLSPRSDQLNQGTIFFQRLLDAMDSILRRMNSAIRLVPE
jgi:hypothetical protein